MTPPTQMTPNRPPATARPAPSALPAREAIVEAVASLREDAIVQLRDLVASPSLLGDEAGAQRLMRAAYDRLGLDVTEFAIDEEKLRRHPAYSPSIVGYDGRRNVVGTHRPRQPRAGGRSLILNGHIDVVPVGAAALWRHSPFDPVLDGDRVYGRGSADMKAGLVACTTALAALRRLGYAPAAPVHLQSVIEEECTGNGALACLLEGYTADAALIPEPTPGIMSGQMGVIWLAIEVLGVPVHAAYAHEGVAAIDFVRYLVERLRTLEARWNEPAARHALYCRHAHPVNFNLGRISGGEWASSVPTQCRADLRLGFYPGVKPADVCREVEALLAQAHAEHPSRDSVSYKVVYGGFQAEGFAVDLAQPIIVELDRCHREIAGAAPEYVAFTGTTDAKFFHLYGDTPATCYGPTGGDIHGINEWVSIDSMQQVASVYALLIARWCGLEPVRD